MAVVYSALVTHEIFEKEKIDEVNKKLILDFGKPSIFENKSGNTTIAGQTNWVLEKKRVWKITNFDLFLKDLKDEQKKSHPKDFDSIFKSRIKMGYVVGLECKELPYYQVVIFIQLSGTSKVPVIIDSLRLIVPFQKYLEKFDGISMKVFANSKNKPRFYTHHISDSVTDYKKGLSLVKKLEQLQEKNHIHKIKPNAQSKAIRNLPILNQFGLPSILSAVNYEGGVLAFALNSEQFGGGGELQGCGITFTDRPDVCVPDFSRQGIEKDIRMFSSNIEIFFSVFGGIDLHLFLTGLSTWLSYFEIIMNELTIEIENVREDIQKSLNENQVSEIEKHREKITKFQGSYAGMGILLESIKQRVIDLIEELSTNVGIFGKNEIPIPQKGGNPLFEDTLTNRVGDLAYFQLISTMIKNKFNSLTKKLESIHNPINQMTNFIYNQTSHNLQRKISLNSIIQIVLIAVIGTFTVHSALRALGWVP